MAVQRAVTDRQRRAPNCSFVTIGNLLRYVELCSIDPNGVMFAGADREVVTVSAIRA
jgi:hypothetical protein